MSDWTTYLILAQLAHKYGLAPVNTARVDQLLNDIDQACDLQEAREIARKLASELGRHSTVSQHTRSSEFTRCSVCGSLDDGSCPGKTT